MPPPRDCLFAYQPVLDQQGRAVALAIIYQNDDGLRQEDDDAVTAARIIVNAYMNAEVIELLGSRKVFVKVDVAFLRSGMISMLPARKTIFELVPCDEFPDEARELCMGYMRMGYTFALGSGTPTTSMASLLDLVAIVKVDVVAMPPEVLVEVVHALRRPGLQLLAENVNSAQQVEACRLLGFDLFQGYHFAQPKVLVDRKPDPRRSHILDLLARLDLEAGDKEIEEALKLSPDLTLHMLRLVNSAAFGMRTQVASMREVLHIFGRYKLGKWLQILLFIASENDTGGWALLELAAKRGRMIESLVQDVTHQYSASQQDRGFIVGMLSLVDVLLGMPMDAVLSRIAVAEEIQQAILGRIGVLGVLLRLCEALEIADFDTAAELASSYHIPLTRVMEVQREATLWAGMAADESAAGDGLTIGQ